MTFGIKRFGNWKTSYWKPEVSTKMHFSANSDEYTGLDEVIFKDILKDELDVPDYIINEKNINKEFGFAYNGNKIPAECMKQIINYYKWRKILFKKICDCVLNNNINALLKKFGCDELKFKYYIPAECNNFSCEEPNYTGGQIEAYIEIIVAK